MGGEPILSIDHLRFGIVGMAVCFVAMVVVSLMTEAPDQETQDLIDEIRYPSGTSIYNVEASTPDAKTAG